MNRKYIIWGLVAVGAFFVWRNWDRISSKFRAAK